MTGFVKLFGSILDSTVWREDHATRLLWVTMLAMADAEGVVEASIPGLADRARITLAECEHGLERLSSPDRYSRTVDHDGRRIQEIDGGWLLLNHHRYRERRTPVAERVARHRKRKASALHCNDVTPEAEAEAEADQNDSLRSSVIASSSQAIRTDSEPASQITPSDSHDVGRSEQNDPTPLPAEPPSPGLALEPPGASDDVPKKRARRKAGPVATDPNLQLVFDRIDHHLTANGRPPLRPSLRFPTAILNLLNRGEPVDDLLLALDLRAQECIAKMRAGENPATAWRYFDAIAPFSLPHGGRPGGWSWSVKAIEAHRAPAAKPAPRSGWVTPEQARAEADERWGRGQR